MDKNLEFRMTTPDSSSAGIGIFDSGFGGLTVMRAIRDLLPQENIIYFGDTARLPYGNKSPETILRYSKENADFLKSLGIKLLIIACNTASSIALSHLRSSLDIPIIGITEQGLEAVVRSSKTGQIAILGTRATIASGFYQHNIPKKLPFAQVNPICCPLFVPLVEEGYIDHPLTSMAIQEYLAPLKTQPIDTILLGCTHYPLLHAMIQKELGPQVSLIDPAAMCAEKTKEILIKHNLLNQNQAGPLYQFYVSDDPERFRRHGEIFLSHPIENVLQFNQAF